MIVIPAASRVAHLAVLFNKDEPEELDLHIFKNDITPDDDTVLGDFVEADFTGYSSANLSSATYTITEGASSSDPVIADYGYVAFTSSTAQTVQNCYGYYLTRRTTGDLWWCERFTDGPYNILNNGDSFSVNPLYTKDTAVV